MWRSQHAATRLLLSTHEWKALQVLSRVKEMPAQGVIAVLALLCQLVHGPATVVSKGPDFFCALEGH